MDVSENNGTPKSSIQIGFSIINHPFWGTPILETPRSSKVYSRSQDLLSVRLNSVAKTRMTSDWLLGDIEIFVQVC